jgi:peroxiredoxin
MKKILLFSFVIFNTALNCYCQGINNLLNKELPIFKGLLLSGDSISSSELKGKVTLLQFLYLGCVPCMHEVPHYNKLFQELDHSQFDLIAICPETYKNLKAFNTNDTSSRFNVFHTIYKIKKIDYRIIAECKDQISSDFRPQCSTISEKFFLRGYPFSVLVDKYGIIRKIYGGFPIQEKAEKEKISQLKSDILKLMNQKNRLQRIDI